MNKTIIFFREERSLTIMELVMVIVLLAVLLLIAIPNFSIFHEIKFRSALRKISSDIRYAQALAIALHDVIGVKFIPAGNYYLLYDPDNDRPLKDPYTQAEFILYFEGHPQYNGIKIDTVDINGGNKLLFNTLGIPLDGNKNLLSEVASISLSYHDKSAIIYIYPNTGLVTIQ